MQVSRAALLILEIAICTTIFQELQADEDVVQLGEEEEGEEFSKCLDTYFPIIFKKCDIGGSSELRKSLGQCSQKLGLKLPCDMEWMVKDEEVMKYDCTGRDDEAADFWTQAEEKCLDGCIVADMNLLTSEGEVDKERIKSFLGGMEIFKENGPEKKDLTEFHICMKSHPILKKDPENCALSTQILECVERTVRKRAGSKCAMDLCKKLPTP